MRPFELSLSILLVLALPALLLVPGRSVRVLGPLLLLLLPLLGLHLWREGYRWQMVPAYGAVMGVALLALWLTQQPEPARALAGGPVRVAAGVGVLLLLLGSAAALLFPIPVLPRPTGPHAVGTLTYRLVDDSREEGYTEAPGDRREIMVQLWYPAQPAPGARPAPWVTQPDRFISALAPFLKLPPFALGHLARVRSHAYPDAPLSDAAVRYPVLLYSHGWTGFRAINSSQMENLASHGYVTVGIDHSYGALAVVFPDGRVALNNPAALPDGAPDDVYDRASTQLETVYSEDQRFLLDQLERWDEGEGATPLTGRLALDQIGLFGHSTGGGAAIMSCSRDPRCRAVAGMDPWVEPLEEETIRAGLDRPFLFMRSEPWTRNNNDQRLSRLIAASSGVGGYRIGLEGTVHRDFTLQGLLSPLTSLLGLSGSRAPRETLAIADDFLLAFFNHTLRDQPAPLLEAVTTPYPGVRLDIVP